ncbi:hypothetical protein TRAPUB_2852 [Trametes pubescens]|uniref:Uncharacterized protein n=1 Tax=Trametes pubescens TaxID=154538 RepID=A0A1M2VF89_TRAPU|nr:hypothetical protein TRAPUB_2852 [Trametes pubescens]
MALRTRLAVSDVLHRGLVWSLLGVSVWGIVMMGVVHRETLKAGREALGPVPTVVPKDVRSTQVQVNGVYGADPTVQEDEKHEVELAEAAIAALKNRSNRA